MSFTFDQLRALDAIVRTGSFAGAGAVLHRVPSAISYLVRGLEEATGLELFDRSHRRAQLTPAGERLLVQARHLLAGVDELTGLAVELRSGWEPELRVVVDGSLPFAPFSRALRRFAQADVPTQLRLDVEYQEGVLVRFDQAEADLAIVYGFEGGGGEEGYDCQALGRMEMLLVAAPDHPLSGAPMSEQGRAQHAELLVRDSSPQADPLRKPSFMGSRNTAYLTDFHSKRIALLEGAGYGWMPRHLIDEDMASGALVLLEAETNRWDYFPQLVRRPKRPLGRAGALFVELLKTPLEGLAPKA